MATPAGIEAIPPLTAEGATSFQYRTALSAALDIPARNAHRRTLLDVAFTPETAGVFLNIQVGDRTFIRLPTVLGDFANLYAAAYNEGVGFVRNERVKPLGKGFLWKLHEVVPFDFPTAAEDEDIIITPQAPILAYGAVPAAYLITAYYMDQTDGDVISKSVAGGSANPRRLYINDMTNSLAQPAAGQSLLDTPLTPAGLNGIADNYKQTAGVKLTGYVYAYDASALGTTIGVPAHGKPTRLHITDVDTELFTVETQEGLLVDRDLENTLGFDLQTLQAWIPESPYVFHQNRNFRFQLDTAQPVGVGTPYAADTQYFAIVGIREPETAGV